MQRILKIATLLFFNLSTSYSQNFEEGYIIKEGKKKDGFIKYYDWIKSPKSIEFKANLESIETKIDAENIDGFSVHGEDFTVKSLSISLSPNQPKLIDKPYKRVIEDGYFFLQVWLKTAEISLYEMIDSKKESHFFVEKEGNFQELFYTKYIVNNGGTNYFQEQKGYIGQLSVLMADCERMIVSEGLAYTRNSLLELCKTYLACKGTTISIEQKVKKDIINFSAGLTAGKILNGDEHFNWGSGLVVRMNFPRHFRNQYLQVEWNNYSIYDNRLKSTGYPDGLLKRSAFGIHGGSHFGNKNLRPFANIGIIIPLINNIDSGILPFTNNLIFGIGLSWKRSIKIEYRENPSGLFRQVSLGYLYNF